MRFSTKISGYSTQQITRLFSNIVTPARLNGNNALIRALVVSIEDIRLLASLDERHNTPQRTGH
ncbi:MAG: hypothetical protein PHO08_07590 [Methylococcales bacterium]|nr:hypothetical protein [Methylococcales bacterium]MDD5633129.1 hypothetical protein [Methylococcales bacterium]